ncbi:MAG: hypothetical protein J6A59_07560 [Lachnospiraceae bacterium]|nr:hypothetical protein [Lachnospiraceae bacterium]
MFQNRATQNIPFNEADISRVVYNENYRGIFLDIREVENTTSSTHKDYTKKRPGINYKSFGSKIDI